MEPLPQPTSGIDQNRVASPNTPTASSGVASGERATRLMLGLAAVGVLVSVSLLSRPRASEAAPAALGPGAARLAARTAPSTPAFALATPSMQMFDGGGLAGHTGIPVPPELDEAGRSNLGIIVGPSLFVWVYGGSDGVRYTVADLRGQVLAGSLTASEVYGAFPEISIPEMEFGSDGRLCEPLMWAELPDRIE